MTRMEPARTTQDSIVTRALAAADAAQAAADRAAELIRQSVVARAVGEAAGFPRYFVVDGVVDRHSVRARWFRRQFFASPALLQRAELLIQMGDEFVDQESGRRVEAGLTEPVAALLTVLRSCDRINELRIGPVRASPRALRGEVSRRTASSVDRPRHIGRGFGLGRSVAP